MLHFLAGFSLCYIIAAMREEWIRACRIADYRQKNQQGYTIKHTPSAPFDVLLPTDARYEGGPVWEPPTSYPPLYLVK